MPAIQFIAIDTFAKEAKKILQGTLKRDGLWLLYGTVVK
jgi:hypothetical protein